MKVKVLLPFRDKDHFPRMYQPGEVVDFEQGRAEHVVKLGLAEPVKEVYEAPRAEEAPKKKTTRKKKTEE